MKYAIWRHENALGNSAEHCINIAKEIKRSGDTDPHIYVELDFQRCFALCIPGVTPDRVHFFEAGIWDKVKAGTDLGHIIETKLMTNDEYKDIRFPPVYAYGLPTYPAMWADIKSEPDATLEFPYEHYTNKHNLPDDAIVMHYREKGTYWKRWDGANAEANRFVDIQPFFNVMLHYANRGYKVIKLGDPKQAAAPVHENIIDFGKVPFEERDMLDDLYAIERSKVYLSTDSGIWPQIGGMKKNMVLSNITSVFCNPREDYLDVVNWLPEETSTLLFKNRETYQDNTEAELIEAVNKYL